MPSFRFEATDASGRSVLGTVDAQNAEEAVRQLAGQGLRLRSVAQETMAAPASTIAAPAPVTPPMLAQTASAPGVPSGGLFVGKLASLEWLNYSRVSHTDLQFFFGQAGRMLRAGINPSKVFADVVPRHPSARLRGASAAMARAASAGRPISEAMSHFPEVFGPEAVGAVRCGEAGGYLPDAFDMLSRQEEEARKLATQIRWPRWEMLVLTFGSLLSLAWTAASKQFMDRALNDASASPADNMSYLFSQAFAALSGPIGIALVVFVVGYNATALWAKSHRRRLVRHSLALRLPVVGRLAASESLSVFSEHLSRLSAAGLSPSRAWEEASRACPNLAYAQAIASTHSIREGATLASLVDRSELVPHEVRQLAATGEATGSIPDAMGQAARYSGDDAQTARKVVAASWYIAALAVSAAVVVIALALFYRGWYDQMFESALGDVYGTEAE